MKKLTHNLARLARCIIIAPLFFPFFIIIISIGLLCDRGLLGDTFSDFMWYELEEKESLLNIMARFINWNY